MPYERRNSKKLLFTLNDMTRSFDPFKIEKLPDRLQEVLKTVPSSHDGDMTYWPCAVRLKDGRVLSCVYLASDRAYGRHWKLYPDRERLISVTDIDSLFESPQRLPARLANKLYEYGESGMGYVIFTVVFADGSRQAYLTGNAVDFIHYPEDKQTSDVVDVLPHEGRNRHPIEGPDYYWCFFLP